MSQRQRTNLAILLAICGIVFGLTGVAFAVL